MNLQEDARVLVIVPAYNEEANISKVALLLEDCGYDYLVINDGSIDLTERILRCAGTPHIELVSNLGIGGAVQTGYKYALEHGYDLAVQFDGDGQHDARYIGDICAPIMTGSADVVVGSRFAGGENEFRSSSTRRAGIRILSLFLRLATGRTVKDVTSGFRAVGRCGIGLFARDYPDDYPEPESLAVAAANGLRIEEVPVSMHERAGGKSSISGLDGAWYMLKVGMSVLIRGAYGKGRRA